MNLRIMTIVLGVMLFIVTGCSNNETGLEGKELGISSNDPTISEEEKENSEINFSSNMLVFDFISSDEVTLLNLGNEYTGSYSLDGENLTVNLEDGESNLRLDFVEFKETPDEYYSYSGVIDDGELSEGDETSQLSNIYNNISMGETYIFLEEK